MIAIMAGRGRLKLSIEGIEATQATQFYRSSRHLDRGTAERDGAVPLVAGKPLGLRLYHDLRAPDGLNVPALVNGEVWCRGLAPGASWRPASRLNGPVPGCPAELIDRGDPNRTLNFRVGEDQARRRLAIRARVWIEPAGSKRILGAWFERTLRFIETRPLCLRLYGVQYRRSGREIPPPSAAEALETLNYVRKTYPLARIDIAGYDTIQFGEDLTDRSGGGCGAGWNKLLLILHRLRTASLSPDLAYALLPRGVPTARVSGSGSSLGVGASFAGDGSSMAQELGHALLRRHAPGGSADDVDPSYPSYGGYQPGSIGEYGFDCSTGAVYHPRFSHDFMSYGDNRWVSPHTYRALLCRSTTRHTRSRESERERLRPSRCPRMYLGFQLDREHRFELTTGLTLPGPPLDLPGPESPFRLELRGAGGRVLTVRKVRYALPAAWPSNEKRLHFIESLSLARGARSLAFRCCRKHPPAVFEIPRKTLSIEITSPEQWKPRAKLSGVLALRWRTVCRAAQKIQFFLRYTADGGRTWLPVDAGLACESCSVDLALLPGGEDCRLQVIASTILETAIAETPPFRVERKPRGAAIAGPPGLREERGHLLELIGTANSPDGMAKENEIVWRSSSAGFLGRGSYLCVSGLEPGLHLITLTAPDGTGGRTEATAMLHLLQPEVESHA